MTVVICAYSRRRLATLKAAIGGVADQLSAADELVLVVDHNQDLLELLGTHELDIAPLGDRVRVIANENGAGLSGARNTGIAVAHGELVAFLDDDAVPAPDWLAELIKPFADPSVIGAGGTVQPTWDTPPPRWFPSEFLWVVGCSYRGVPEHPTQIRNPIGANMAFRRHVFDQAGGFTDGIGRVGRTPLGCEETELSIRATRTTGGRILHQPTARVDHVIPADRMSGGYFIRRCWAEGLSKAVVSRIVGSDSALASERAYTTRTLPSGIAAGLRDALRGKPEGIARAAAMVGGLAVTTAGYVRGSAARSGAAQHAGTEEHADATRTEPPSHASGPQLPSDQATFTPIWSGQIELTAPRLTSALIDRDGAAFERARLLVRACGTPLGFLDIDTPGGATDAGRCVKLAGDRFGVEVAAAIAGHEWIAPRRELFTVVLCTRDRPAGARRTLEALMAVRHENLEILVVDNAPSDGATAAVVGEIQRSDPRVRYVMEPHKGLSRARNRGLKEAAGDYVAFTDDDVRVDPLWINGLLRGFDRGSAVACVTGLVASSSLATAAEQYFDARVWWSSSCQPRTYTEQRGPDDSPLHPYTAGVFGTGANFAARTAVLRALGGFDECLGAGSATRGGEDLDIFVRLLNAHHQLSYEPSALVWHDHRVDDASLREQMYAYGSGLTAYLTKYLLAPRSCAALARRALSGVGYGATLMRRSRAASMGVSLETSTMSMVELRGMMAGPILYLRARRHEHRGHRRAVVPDNRSRQRAADRT